MTRHFGLVAPTVGALATGTLVFFLAACGSDSVGASVGTATSHAAHACHPGPSAHCAGAHLAGANLSHLNLSNADFAYADLSDADLGSANLTGADLRGADLGIITDAPSLRGAIVTSAQLTAMAPLLAETLGIVVDDG